MISSKQHNILYEETVPFRSFWRRVIWVIVALVFAAIGVTLRETYGDEPDVEMVVRFASDMLYGFAGLAAVNGILAFLLSELQIDISESQLVLRHKGFIRKRISLSEISSVVISGVETTQSGWMFLIRLLGGGIKDIFYEDFTSDQVATKIIITLGAGKEIKLPTRNPAGLGEILRKESERVFKAETLAMVDSYRQ